MFEEVLLILEKKNLSDKKISEIKSILSKLQIGFQKTGKDWTPLSGLKLTKNELKELKPFAKLSKDKLVIFASAVTKWLQKIGALKSLFIPGMSGFARVKKGSFAGASPAEFRAKGSPVMEKPRKFVGGYFGAAEFQRPLSRSTVTKLQRAAGFAECMESMKYIFEAKEKRLPSGTASMLRAQLKKDKGFSSFTDDDWMKFGKRVKKRGGTASVFTGLLAALLKYLVNNPRGLPATDDYALKFIYKPSKEIVRLKDVSGGKFMGVGELSGFIELTQVTAKEALKGNHTNVDKKLAKQSPSKQVNLWFIGDELKGLVKFLKGKKVSIKAESADKPFPIDSLKELFKCQEVV